MPSSTELEARHELLNEILRQATSILLRLESVKGTSQRRALLMNMYVKIKTELIRCTRLVEIKEGATGGSEPVPTDSLADQSILKFRSWRTKSFLYKHIILK